MPAAAQPERTDAVVSRATGELCDRALERVFLDDLARDHHRVWFHTAIGIAVVFVCFSLVDLASLGVGPTWLTLLVARVVAAVVVVLAGREVDRRPERFATERGRLGILAAQVVTAAVALWVTALRPEDAMTSALSLTVFTVACIVMVPGRFRDQVTVGTSVAAGLVAVSVTRFDDPTLPTLPLVANLAGALLLGATVRVLMNRDQRHRWLAVRRLSDQLAEGDTLRRELERLARTDDLTGAANRREFLTVLAARLADRRGAVAVVMLDLDRFKSVNDRYGHPVGDAVLVSVVSALHRSVRDGDTVARLGGEEFGVVLPGLGHEDATEAAERMRRAVVDGTPDDLDAPVTASFGVAVHRRAESVESLLARADAAVYRAKRAGGDAVAGAGAPPPVGADGPGRGGRHPERGGDR